MEYVATTGSAIRELGEVELEQRRVLDEDARDLGTREGGLHAPRRRPPRARRPACPCACADSSASTSSSESRTSAPSTSIDPSSAIAGTRRPVAPNQRYLTARSSRPGRGREQLDPGGEQPPQRVGRPGEERERAVVGGDDARGADELGRDRRLLGAHRVVVADREDRDVGGVEPPDQRHVAEDVRVARDVDRRAVVRPQHEAARLAEVDVRPRPLEEWLASVSVIRDVAERDRAALVRRLAGVVGEALCRRASRGARPARRRGTRSASRARRRRRRGRRARG